MEVVLPQKVGLSSFRYEINEEEWVMYADEFLRIQVDFTEDKFGTYEKFVGSNVVK